MTDVIAAREEQRLLLRALRKIPVDDLVAVELHYWRGLTGRELAAVWGVPEGTARTRLRRARLVLEAKIEALAASPSECTSTLSGLDGWLASLAGLWRPPAAS
jgi:RNA polymerase sigma-70 factor (ECF subfamily)